MKIQLENLIVRFYSSGKNNAFPNNFHTKSMSENLRLNGQEPTATRVKSKQIEWDSNK